MQSQKRELESVKKSFNKLQENYIERKSHEALMGDEDDLDGGRKSKGTHNKNKLIENEELAWQQGEKLENAKRGVLEAEGISLGVMRDLNHQTGKLKIITDKVGEMNQEIDESNTIMSRITKNENRNKIIIGVIAIITVLAIILILYFNLAPSTSTKSPNMTSLTDKTLIDPGKNSP